MKTVQAHLVELIRIPSKSSLSNKAVIDYAAQVLCTADWQCDIQAYCDQNGIEKFNLIAAPQGQDVALVDVELALLCHTDTVPPAADWTRALQPFEEAGMLYGCGSCDVKGFLASLLMAAEGPRVDFKPRMRIVLTADEEVGCLGSYRLLSEGRLRPRRLVIGEPTAEASKGGL